MPSLLPDNRHTDDSRRQAATDTGTRTFLVQEPDQLSTPLVFASPHSGRLYPSTFMSACTAELIDLRRIEDAYVDLLFGSAPEHGAPLIAGLVGRACLDLNRAPDELDAAMFSDATPELVKSLRRSPRVAAGLGCIPRLAHGGARIYGRRLAMAEAQDRLNAVYHPYHCALDALLARARSTFGASVLVDCHSMPSRTDAGTAMPDIVLGDRFGAACAPGLTRRLEQAFRALGYTVARNAPYAGGFITMSRGRPEKRSHAIQIEVNRRLYMDERTVEPSAAFETVQADLSQVVQDLKAWATDFVNPAQREPSRRQRA